jgi:hypothetical protein
MSEHDEQVKLFKWASTIPELNAMIAVPNGGHRHVAVAAKLKQEGVKAGVPDILIFISRGNYHGMMLELKFNKGRLSKHQITWLERLNNNGYRAVVAFGFDDAKKQILEYLAL